jgi:hypothetical protein
MLRDLGREWNGQEWQMRVLTHPAGPLLRLQFSATESDDLSEAAE